MTDMVVVVRAMKNGSGRSSGSCVPNWTFKRCSATHRADYRTYTNTIPSLWLESRLVDSRTGTYRKGKSLHPNTVNEHGGDWGNIPTTHLCPLTWNVCISLMKHMQDTGYKTGHICAAVQRCLRVAFKTTACLSLQVTAITKITKAMSVSIQFLSCKGK
jgi:hypothetical protein